MQVKLKNSAGEMPFSSSALELPLKSHNASDRHVILVDLYWTRDKDPRVPLGHASLLAALHEAGVSFTSIVRAVNEAAVDPEALAQDVMSIVLNRTGDVDVAIGAYVWGEEIIQVLLPSLRRLGFTGRIILGGPQISYAGAGLESIYPQADAFVRGYGEEALVALAKQAGRPQIRGVHYVGEVDRKEQAEIDLGLIPSPWLGGAVPLANQRFIRWETQRGCPYACTFCQHRESGKVARKRDLGLDRLLKEIELFVQAGVADIAVLDPVFNLGRNAVVILQAFARHGYRGRLSLQCRAESLTAEFLDAVGNLDVRLEFGLQTIHADEDKAVRRNNQLPKIEAALAQVRARNISHEVSLIFGLPEQTLDSFKASVQWCIDRSVPVIKAFPLMLLRGTQLDAERSRWALHENDEVMPVVVESNSFTTGDWAAMAKLSDALKKTEGEHPAKVTDLAEAKVSIEPELGRWTPANVSARA
ncbi:MAG: radical SAM protein [Planctomycetes bacterium]|nr:radical SAM protein [Planctomycetota bacterium]